MNCPQCHIPMVDIGEVNLEDEPFDAQARAFVEEALKRQEPEGSTWKVLGCKNPSCSCHCRHYQGLRNAA